MAKFYLLTARREPANESGWAGRGDPQWEWQDCIATTKDAPPGRLSCALWAFSGVEVLSICHPLKICDRRC